MNKKILFLVLSTCIFASVPSIILAAPAAPYGICDAVKNVNNLLWKVGATIVVIGWVIAGILYLTSVGSTEKTTIAKKALIAAVIGTVLVAIATIAGNLIVDALNPGGTLAPGC